MLSAYANYSVTLYAWGISHHSHGNALPVLPKQATLWGETRQASRLNTIANDNNTRHYFMVGHKT
jgi:hypothetical protein